MILFPLYSNNFIKNAFNFFSRSALDALGAEFARLYFVLRRLHGVCNDNNKLDMGKCVFRKRPVTVDRWKSRPEDYNIIELWFDTFSFSGRINRDRVQRLWKKVQIKRRLPKAQSYKAQCRSKRTSFNFDAKHSCRDSKQCFEEH